MVFELVPRARTVRKFVQEDPVGMESLRALINLARLSPCSANLQTLKFLPSSDPRVNQVIFGHLAWAGYLRDWPGPEDGERPAAYIVVLADENLGPGKEVDAGLALQSMVLGAASLGLGTCILGSLQRAQLHASLGLPAHLRVLYVLALGKPAETARIEPVGPDGDVRYWRDGQGTFHVPKRSLDDLIVEPGPPRRS